MKPGSAALILDYETLGEAYAAVQALPEGLETFELIPASRGTTLIVGGTLSAMTEIDQRLPKPRARRNLTKISDVVAKAWLGLENPPLAKTLIIFESSKIGDVFEAAVRLENAGATPFDLRILRGGDARAYVLATGSAPADDAMTGLDGKLTVIREPSSHLKDLFEIRPY